MDLLRQKLKATTLPESLIAMVIILLVFGIAISIFANVMDSSSIHEKIRAEIILQNLLVKTKTDKNFFDGEMEINGIRIIKKIASYSGAEGLSMISLTAFDRKNKQITERSELIFTE